jgi:hypothetical protein
MDLIPIPIKVLIPAIPKDEEELRELAEDLRVMGCEGLLAKPWILRSEDTLREFKYERGNQWDHTQEERSGELDSGCLEQGLRISERDFRGMGRSPGRIVHRQIQRRCGLEGRFPPGELQEQEGEKGVGVFTTHLESGQAQMD